MRATAPSVVCYDSPMDTIRCPKGCGPQKIVGTYTEDTGDSRRTVEEYTVSELACGHDHARLARTYRSPLQQAGPTRAMALAERDRLLGEEPW